MTITKNATDAWVIGELTLTGDVVHEYPMPLGSFPHTFSPDGRNFLYRDTHGKWILRNLVTATEEILFIPEKTEYLVHPAFSPDGKTIAFSLIIPTAQHYDRKLCLVTAPNALVQTIAWIPMESFRRFLLMVQSWRIGNFLSISLTQYGIS